MKKLYNKKWQDIFGKRRLRLLIGLVPICVFIFTCNLWTLPADAATLCVNPGGTNGCYAMPSAAVTAAVAGDTILVHSGTYQEQVTIWINKAGLKIEGDNPSNTKVTQSPALASVDVFTVSASSVEIAGLTITGSGNGIYVNATSTSIHNNYINYNKNDGILASVNGDGFIAFNNVIKGNTNDGIGTGGINTGGEFVHSNIIFGNGNAALSSVDDYTYNSTYANKTNAPIGNGNIQQDCLFVNESADPPDFRLQTTSPCKNTGNPGYLDADGTRSDMGSFGGPSAALFWPYGNGGPVVTNLTIDPPYVPQGGTLSIKGTVEIR